MPPTAKPKTPTILAELAQLAANLKAVPYEDLASAARTHAEKKET